MTNYIWVTTQREMFHRYPDAPDEVSFLRNQHRHMMKFRIYLEVFGDDRDVEFFIFQRFVNRILDGFNNIDNKSCEMISNIIANNIRETYSKRKIKIEVSEDGENGVEFQYDG